MAGDDETEIRSLVTFQDSHATRIRACTEAVVYIFYILGTPFTTACATPMVPYVATTEEITVTVRPVYLDRESDYFEQRFVFGYFIKITNDGEAPVRLLRRFWRIEEEGGRLQEVDGLGVIGKQPLIGPGEEHSYSSYSVLQAFEGSMGGYYTMERSGGEQFRVTIPRFALRAMAN